MKDFDTRTYSVSDFLEWQENKSLELSPKFQRRSVWKSKAKSYLIDTILRGRPMPKIILQQQLRGSRTVRVVIDGQQRLRTILEYLGDGFRVSRAHSKDLAKLYFSGLPKELRDEFLQYSIGVDVVFNLPYPEMLDIFGRINSYTVSLNGQEKLNAQYVGYFKTCSYRLGQRYVEYFVKGGILRQDQVARMGEAELASDLLVSLVEGVQSSKSIPRFYKKYEDEADHLEQAESSFNRVMMAIGLIYSPEDLAEANWSKVPLFYSLFTAVAHCVIGLKGLDNDLRLRLKKSEVPAYRVALDEISAELDEVDPEDEESTNDKGLLKFAEYARRRTADTSARIYRANFICRRLRKVRK